METPRMATCIPLPLEQKVLAEVVLKAKDWALMHGACMRSKVNFTFDALQFAPFILVPSTFPRKEFEKAVQLQPILNELVHKVANDADFLTESLKSTIEVDEFTGSLFKIYQTTLKEGVKQPISLGLIRSDLMLESSCPATTTCCQKGGCPGSSTAGGGGGELAAGKETYCCWKQVEINTIASGFGWLGPSSAAIHRYVLQELGHGDLLKNIPENKALEGLCGGMIKAWELYGDTSAVILFVIEDVTYNICDQRFHEFEIRRQRPDITVLRRTLTQLADTATLGSKAELLIDGKPVGVVYYRAGYEPGHYHGPREWDARLMIARSLAIECPSISYHLAGTKKVQQALAHPGVLERFISRPDQVGDVKEIFTGLYSLDFTKFGEEALEMALADPERFVLKPQREGGGNNVYGAKVGEALRAMRHSKERTAWILMEKIRPPVQSSYMVRPGSEDKLPELTELVSELGIFGVIIGNGDGILVNEQVGHMLRTKLSTSDEGGVAAGSGALDSPYLID